MNIVCIISNSPSATNTATVRNYDELRYTCQELSIETKEKNPLLQKWTLKSAENCLGFIIFFFL